jgi:hypothetical protein
VFIARGLVCGCVIEARECTPLARVVFLGKQASIDPHTTQDWMKMALWKQAGAPSSGEGRGPTWPYPSRQKTFRIHRSRQDGRVFVSI